MDSQRVLKKFNTSYVMKMSPDGKYLVRTSSAAVYVHDPIHFEQIAVFKDMKYQNQFIFSNDSKLLAVKSSERKIAIYDLDRLNLINKIYIRKTSQPQDGGFCFSKDNRWIYNTVYHNDLLGSITRIHVKEGTIETIFQPDNCVFKRVSYIKEKGIYLFTGFERTRYDNKHFVIEYNEDTMEFKRIDTPQDFRSFYYHPSLDAFIVNGLGERSIKLIKSDYTTVIKELRPLSSMMERIVEMGLSPSLKYLSVVSPLSVRLISLPSLTCVEEIRNTHSCYASFSLDDSLLFIGTWSHGFIYPLNKEQYCINE